MEPGDEVDNDCDTIIDEEIFDGKDDDDDNFIDEDVKLVCNLIKYALRFYSCEADSSFSLQKNWCLVHHFREGGPWRWT